MFMRAVLAFALVVSQTAAGLHGLAPSETAIEFGGGTSVGNALLETADGGLITAGYTTGSADGAGGEDVLVIRTDAAGRTVWSRTIGGAGDDSAWAIARRPGGGYIVAGYTASFGADGEDVLVIGIDDAGATEWTRTIGGAGNQRAWAMTPLKSGGFAIAAQTDHGPGGGWDALVIKIDDTGKELWSRAFGGTGVDRLFGIAAHADGSVIVTGSRSATAGAPLGVLAARLDAAGSVMWDHRFGGAKDSLGHSVIGTSDGSYLITGYGQNERGDNDIALTKLSASGAVVWSRTRGGIDDDRGMMSIELPSGAFASVGYRHTTGADWEIWIGQSRADGTPDGERLLGTAEPDRGVALVRTRFGFALTGQIGTTTDNTSRLIIARLAAVR